MPAFRLFEWLQSLGRSAENPDLPPAYYRVLTTGIADREAYVGVGQKAAAQLTALADDAGLVLGPQTRVLEFGCGCGRVLRALAEIAPVQLFGCDLHRGMVRWCQTHLRGQYVVSKPKPPLPYAAGQFDMVYALSVFTHMTDAPARAWLAELGRVTRPGGIAILSFWDEHAAAAEPFRDELARSGFHLKRGGTQGSNLMVGFFSHAGFAERAEPQWERLSSISSPESSSMQAMMVLRRR
jgi:SAM-dependent methyltransferase